MDLYNSSSDPALSGPIVKSEISMRSEIVTLVASGTINDWTFDVLIGQGDDMGPALDDAGNPLVIDGEGSWTITMASASMEIDLSANESGTGPSSFKIRAYGDR